VLYLLFELTRSKFMLKSPVTIRLTADLFNFSMTGKNSLRKSLKFSSWGGLYILPIVIFVLLSIFSSKKRPSQVLKWLHLIVILGDSSSLT
jgi:hypothetical protein